MSVLSGRTSRILSTTGLNSGLVRYAVITSFSWGDKLRFSNTRQSLLYLKSEI